MAIQVNRVKTCSTAAVGSGRRGSNATDPVGEGLASEDLPPSDCDRKKTPGVDGHSKMSECVAATFAPHDDQTKRENAVKFTGLSVGESGTETSTLGKLSKSIQDISVANRQHRQPLGRMTGKTAHMPSTSSGPVSGEPQSISACAASSQSSGPDFAGAVKEKRPHVAGEIELSMNIDV